MMPAEPLLAPLAPALLAGLIGSGIQGSRTPAMHEREGAARGLRYLYKLIDLAALSVGPEALPELLLHDLSDDARALRAAPGTPVPPEFPQPSRWVAEIIHFPLETELLKHARAKGCHTLDGGGMAVLQAVEAFRLITGIEPDAARMLRHFAAMGRD